MCVWEFLIGSSNQLRLSAAPVIDLERVYRASSWQSVQAQGVEERRKGHGMGGADFPFAASQSTRSMTCLWQYQNCLRQRFQGFGFAPKWATCALGSRLRRKGLIGGVSSENATTELRTDSSIMK